ncbi:hypothetical protein NP493_410g04035 [Ridgeia piscesae]|uniref:P-type domain-containing protein n=1 Tax=Ridgeia piscesae TaxID=27915 RepID=A0AAD9L0Q8_RIDPI|nr:hypothetical protein NP493_410g04035 [Ridgeia piscesae]
MASPNAIRRSGLLCLLSLLISFVSFVEPRYVMLNDNKLNKANENVFTYSKVAMLNRPEKPTKNNFRFEMDQIEQLYGPANSLQCTMDDSARFDCHPDTGAHAAACEARGCCWAPASTLKVIDVPYCFFPTNYNGYYLDQAKNTESGFSSRLLRPSYSKSGWPGDVFELQLEVAYETKTRLHFKIYDPNNKRYEVPIPTPKVTEIPDALAYGVNVIPNPFGIAVFRKSTGAVLFNSEIPQAPLIFSDQFLQMSTATGSGLIYGLGEHQNPFLINSTWKQFSFWARDVFPMDNTNLYGSHPFYLGMEKDGSAYGVFMLNSNAMDVEIQPMPAVTFRTIGGILDFYVFTGPTPDDVIRQYTEVIGLPVMPPYWSFGFHLCRYGYKNSTEVQTVINRNRALGIPYEVQWTDIDYMDRYLDWTYDKEAYGTLPDVVKNLHDHDQKHIIIVDPGISNQYPGSYAPYDDGVKAGIFVKNATGQILVGSVWPGKTAFPDFSHPGAAEWWYQHANNFHKEIPYDGLWTDMNEPSNMGRGGSTVGCTNNKLDKPPYTPGIRDGDLTSNTLCPSAKHYEHNHYDVHSLYGHMEANATHAALQRILGKRSLVITRSSFAGTGQFAGHWSGDIASSWEDMYYTIPQMLNFQMFGIPMFGADICGFREDTTEELCVRWMQLGAFYPFMRNHNDIHSKDQDPAVFSANAQKAMKLALLLRYSLLPHLYTLMHDSHISGSAVVRPLFFQYPTDKNTYVIDRQFLWGDTLLISPVLTQGQTVVSAYFPRDLWYDIYEGQKIVGNGSAVQLQAPIQKINVHVRGGSIVPMQQPDVTTVAARKKPFGLLVALNVSMQASGTLYWDDGESLDTDKAGTFTSIHFTADKDQLTSQLQHVGYRSEMTIDSVRVMGLSSCPTSATVNSRDVTVYCHGETKV